jgi:hypothetical protein
MVDFASYGDVAARWRPLSIAEIEIADMLCADASDMIRARWPDVDARIDSGALAASSVTRVVAGMVKRAMLVGPNEGVESSTQTAGPFSTSAKYANPTGALFFGQEDIRLFEPESFVRRAVNGWLA